MGQTVTCQDERLSECAATRECAECVAVDEDNEYFDGDLGGTEAMKGHKLLAFARDGNLEGVTEMLAISAYVEVRRPFVITTMMQTPPEIAAAGGTLRAQGMTPLMYAAQGGHTACCECLLDAGAKVDAEDEDGHRPLHFAAASGSFSTCELLVKRHSHIDARTDDDKKAIDLVPAEEMAMRSTREPWLALLGERTVETTM
eukprot:TRINITY_DN16862_c0_g1_i1.p1 TRINITY_DN16862_c0_g1~~TRINITY_DN16862_c0_g1_i1.p1  ORF type:complete len:201 (-),score=41.32 TRINITY_DN16862_c0_g1_i1:9-611(-)